MRKKILTLCLMAILSCLFVGCEETPQSDSGNDDSDVQNEQVEITDFNIAENDMTLTEGVMLDTQGVNDYDGYVGIKFTVGDADIVVTKLGRIGMFMSSEHELVLMNETKAVVANAKLTKKPDAAKGKMVYANVVGSKEIVLKANSTYYLFSKEAKGDFWYGEGTNIEGNPYVVIDSIAMTKDLYEISVMENTENCLLGPVDFVFQVR